MKRDPSERYASVTALADDLHRFLRHEPISARPDTWGYRAAQFVRRHVHGVVTTVVIAVMLSGLPRDLNVTLSRLIALYDAWRKPERAALYRAQLAGHRLTSNPEP